MIERLGTEPENSHYLYTSAELDADKLKCLADVVFDMRRHPKLSAAVGWNAGKLVRVSFDAPPALAAEILKQAGLK